MASETSSGSTESRFPTATGLSASITMRLARRTGWTTTISENRTSSGRSPGPTRSFKDGRLTLRSPDILHHGQFHLAYANQIAQATSPITGGLICPVPITEACPSIFRRDSAPVDHDQRNTLNLGFNGILPWKTYASANVYYGSGFTNGLYGTPHAQYPGPLSAQPHHIRSLARQDLRREIHFFRKCVECG